MSRSKLTAIIVGCIVAVIVLAVVAANPPPSTETEPVVPDHSVTYTDQLGLFSISYPSQWALALEYMEGVEQAARDIIDSIVSDRPVGRAGLLFMAGLSTATGDTTMSFNPNVVVNAQPLPEGTWTHNKVVTAQIEGLKSNLSDYQEISRVRTTVDNRAATIIEFQGSIAGSGTRHNLVMLLLVGRSAWTVMCTSFPGEFSGWEDDFDAIVRSLRILK